MEKKDPTGTISLSICQKIFNALIPTFRPLRRLTNATPNDGVKVLTHMRESSAFLKPEPVTHAIPNKPTDAFPPLKPIAYNRPLHEPAVKEKEKAAAAAAPPPPAVEAFTPKPNAYNSQPRPPPLVAPTPPPSIAQDKVAKAEPVAIPPQKPVATATTTNTKIAVEPPLEKDKADDKVVLAPAPAPLPPPPPKAAPKPQPPPLPAAPQRKKTEKVDDNTIPTKAKVRTGSGVGRVPSSK